MTTLSYFLAGSNLTLSQNTLHPHNGELCDMKPLPSVITPESTLMFQEAAEAATRIRAQAELNRGIMADAVKQLQTFNPIAIVTCARGSSDHAATYGKYLFETHLGLITASAAPSVTSIYQAQPKLKGMLFIAISQSGKSPDLLASVAQAKASGALTLALVNQAESPLAELADIVIPLHAGHERSVAATKSYLSTLSALLHLTAVWSNNAELLYALQSLPDALEAAWSKNWASPINKLEQATNLFVLGRGIGFGAAQEAALKLKETCGLHAEAFSTAEVKHGPMAIVKEGFPILLFAQQDKTLAGVENLINDFRARKATLLIASERATGDDILPVVEGAHPVIAPILAIQSFYRMANALSIARGYNPDEPPHLRKVTETV